MGIDEQERVMGGRPRGRDRDSVGAAGLRVRIVALGCRGRGALPVERLEVAQ